MGQLMDPLKIRKEIANKLDNSPDEAKKLALELLAFEPKESANYKNLAICFARNDELDRCWAILEVGRKKIARFRTFFDEVEASICRDFELFESLTDCILSLICATDQTDQNKAEVLCRHSDVVVATQILDHMDQIVATNAKDGRVIAEVMFVLFKSTDDFKARRNWIERLLSEFDGDDQLDIRGKSNLATIYLHYKRSLRAIRLLKELTKTKNPDLTLLLELAKALHKNANNSESLTVLQRLLEIDPKNKEATRIKAFILHYDDQTTIDEIQKATLKYGDLIRSDKYAPAKNRNRPGPLRVGFFSHSFKTHPVGWMSAGFFCEVSKLQGDAEIHILAAVSFDDFIAKTIQDSGNSYHDLTHKTGDEIEQVIYDLHLDVLVDMDGMTAISRIENLLRKPAPVLVKWVGGLVGSMWLPEYDFLITDTHQTPSHLEDDFSEELILMDNSYVTYTPPPYGIDVLEPPAKYNGHVTFGCFNNAAKLSSTCCGTWSQILAAVEDSVLILKDTAFGDNGTRKVIKENFRAHGIPSNRLEFRGGSPHELHLQHLSSVDICLDPMPYSGGLSTLEAIYMGIPVISLEGRLLCHRHSTSHLSIIGRDEFIAKNTAQYVDKVTTLASDPERVLEYRHTLRKDLLESPLLDHQTFAKELIKKMAALV